MTAAPTLEAVVLAVQVVYEPSSGPHGAWDESGIRWCPVFARILSICIGIRFSINKIRFRHVQAGKGCMISIALFRAGVIEAGFTCSPW